MLWAATCLRPAGARGSAPNGGDAAAPKPPLDKGQNATIGKIEALPKAELEGESSFTSAPDG